MVDLNHKDELYGILNSISDGLIILDKDWKFIYINKTIERHYAIKRESFIGKNYWEVFPKAKSLKFWEEFNRAVNEQIPVHFEEYSPTFRQWVAISAFPSEGGIAIYSKDITWEKKLQEKIKQEEENQRILINSTDDAMWYVDKNYVILLCNTQFKKWIAGFVGKELDKGDNVLYDGYSPVYLDKFEMCYKIALQGKTFAAIEDVTVEGEKRFISVNFIPVFNDASEVIGVSCYARDITYQRRHLLKIEEQNKILKEIAFIQSHKIRGPVATILGLTQLFNYSDPHDPVNKEIIDGVTAITRQLDETIREVVQKTNNIPD